MAQDDDIFWPRVRRVFTFGHGQPNFPGYVVVYGQSGADCRDRMFTAYGRTWSQEYLTEEDAGVYELELPLIAVLGEDDLAAEFRRGMLPR